MIQAPLSIPVRYRSTERGGKRDITRFGLVYTTIPLITDPDEAPVAVRWNDAGRTREYRLFEGSLWSRLTDGWGHGIHRQKELWPGDCRPGDPAPDRHHWANLLYDMSNYMRVADHPFRSGETWAKKDIPATQTVRFDMEVNHDLECRRISAEMLARAADSIVFGGDIWRRSVGPILTYTNARRYIWNFGPELVYAHPDDLNVSQTIESRAFRFSGLDPDAAIDAVSRGFGESVRIFGHAPEILIAEGYSTDLIPMTGESLAWHMIRATKDLTPDSMPLEAIAAIASLRAALSANWPGVDLDFAPTLHETTWQHSLGKKLPDPTPLVPAMDAVVSSHAGVVPDGVLKAWAIGAGRIHRASLVAVPDRDDEAAFAGMVV